MITRRTSVKLVRVEGEVTAVYHWQAASWRASPCRMTAARACRVFIDGYIGYSDEASHRLWKNFVAEGAYISAVGFVSHDAEGNRLRVRDRSEILPAEAGRRAGAGRRSAGQRNRSAGQWTAGR